MQTTDTVLTIQFFFQIQEWFWVTLDYFEMTTFINLLTKATKQLAQPMLIYRKWHPHEHLHMNHSVITLKTKSFHDGNLVPICDIGGVIWTNSGLLTNLVMINPCFSVQVILIRKYN